MKKNVLIIGAGGVAKVVAHKCAQHNDELGEIAIASRSVGKCQAIIDSVKAKGKRIADGMQRIIRRHGPDSLFLKGRGMMIGISCPDGEIAAAVCRHAFENGLVIETSGAHSEVVKCLCPLIISDEQIDKALSILDKAFAAVMSEQTENQAS